MEQLNPKKLPSFVIGRLRDVCLSADTARYGMRVVIGKDARYVMPACQLTWCDARKHLTIPNAGFRISNLEIRIPHYESLLNGKAGTFWGPQKLIKTVGIVLKRI